MNNVFRILQILFRQLLAFRLEISYIDFYIRKNQKKLKSNEAVSPQPLSKLGWIDFSMPTS